MVTPIRPSRRMVKRLRHLARRRSREDVASPDDRPRPAGVARTEPRMSTCFGGRVRDDPAEKVLLHLSGRLSNLRQELRSLFDAL